MRRRLLPALGLLLLLLFGAAAAGLWWLGTDGGLRFAMNRLQQTVSAQGGELALDETTGSLYRGIRIGRLSWRSGDGMQVEGSDLAMRWSLPGLLRRQLLIPELSASQLTVRLAPAEPAPAPRQRIEMPGDLSLPLSLELERLAIGELRVVPAAAPGEPPAEPVVVSDIGATLAYRDGALVVEELGARTPYGRLADARLQIGDRAPHALQARLGWEGEVAKLPLDLTLEADGDLNATQANLAGTVADARIALAAKLAPLEVMPLLSAQAEVANLDLRQLHEAAPRTLVDAKVDLAPAATPAGGWDGSIALRNQDSGSLSQGRLPLLALDTRVSLTDPDDPLARQLQLQDLRLTLPATAASSQSASGHAPTGQTPTGQAGATESSRQGNPAPAGSAEGRISGSIAVQPGRTLELAGNRIPAVQAALDFEAIDLAQFGAQLPPTALDGKLGLKDNAFTLNLAQSASRMRALLPASLADAAAAAEVVLRGRLDESLLRLEEARLRLGESSLSASGQAGLAAPHRIALKGDARNVELARWLPAEGIDARWRDGRISGHWSIDGKAVPGLDAWLTLALADSTLAGKPLSARIESRVVLNEQWAPRRLERSALDLRFGDNRVRANGALGEAGDKLALELSLADPGLLDPRLAGRLTLTGDVTGAFDRLRARLLANGERLAFGPAGADGMNVASLRIEASGPITLPVPERAPLEVKVRLRDLEAGGRKVGALDLAVSGPLADHRFDLSALAEGHTLKLNGSGRATLDGDPSWQARLAAATLDGKVPIRLTAPASLRVAASGLRLSDFRLAVAGGNASLEQLLLGWGEAFSFDTRGNARELPVYRLLALANTNPDVPALQALRLNADWNVRGSGAEDLDGTARVALREVASTAAAGASGAATAAADNDRLGLEGDNGANLTFRNGQLDGRFDLRLPSLAFTHPLTAPDVVLDGRLRLAGSVGGPVVQPQWRATLSGENLSVLHRSIGWRLTDGALTARFDGRKVQLQTFEFKSGEGSVALRGEASLLDAPRPEPARPAPAAARDASGTVLPIDGRFELTTSRFEVPLGPGQRVAVSGVTRLESSADGLSLRGKLRADHGIIEIQGSAAPSLPDDVRLVVTGPQGRRVVDAQGRTVSKEGALVEPEMPRSRLRVLTDLAVDLGERLRITGNGVAARLGGSLQVLGTLPDQPRLVGTVNIVEGSYQAHGQNLRIDKGAAVRFNGPPDNPALDIVAKRPFLPVEVGVRITGTVLNPVITLVSTPEMSDTDRLSWLVLGTDPRNAPSAAQSLALREAARSMLLNDDGRQRPGIAERLGLDVVNFGYGSDTGPMQGITESKNPTGLPGASSSSSASTTQQEVVTLGKRIGSRLFVSYEHGVRGLYNLLQIQYSLSRRLSVRAQSGSDNAVDLLFSHSFD